MDMKRAQEIIQSKERIPVHYRGKSIWISSLNPQNLTAEIKFNIFSEETETVPVDELSD